jgi:hypothetical protein
MIDLPCLKKRTIEIATTTDRTHLRKPPVVHFPLNRDTSTAWSAFGEDSNMRLYHGSLRPSVVAVLACVFALFAWTGQADTISTLYNTGVDDNGNVIPYGGGQDSHYLVSGAGIEGPLNPYVAYYPSAGWIGADSSSAWVTPSSNTWASCGAFTYETTFDLTGFDPSSAIITGFLAAADRANSYPQTYPRGDEDEDEDGDEGAENQTVQIRLNDTPYTFDPPGGFPAYANMRPFALENGFISGINHLEFHVYNDATYANPTNNPTGLRVEMSGTAHPLPEPATLLLLGVGLSGFAIRRQLGKAGK